MNPNILDTLTPLQADESILLDKDGDLLLLGYSSASEEQEAALLKEIAHRCNTWTAMRDALEAAIKSAQSDGVACYVGTDQTRDFIDVLRAALESAQVTP